MVGLLPRKPLRTALACLFAFAVLIYWIQLRLPSTNSEPTHRYVNKEQEKIRDPPTHRYVNKGQEKIRDPIQLRDGAFYVDGKPMTILSGAIHYFRVVPAYWEDRLQRLKAAGLNTVETYVPWNLHEEIRHQHNYEGILNIRGFIETAHRLGLLVILRPGPYICSEWDLGGLPSWLLRDADMKLRTTYPPFLAAVDDFFDELISRVENLQYQYGGPIIAMQVENEYGAAGSDVAYMRAIKASMEKHGVIEPLFTSDNNNGLLKGAIPGVFMTINFKNTQHGLSMFKSLDKIQPGKPRIVMEYWTGWFDHWEEKHHTTSIQEFTDGVSFILGAKSSINLYMFHGGTNFGFMNGANFPYTPTVTSYDYDAPLTEAGDTSDKYLALRKIIAKSIPNVSIPAIPEAIPKTAYSKVDNLRRLSLEDVLSLLEPQHSTHVVPMEMLDINNRGGQGYGFTLYRRSAMPQGRSLQLLEMHDRAQVFVDGNLRTTLHTNKQNRQEPIDLMQEVKQLDILVENCGRGNYGNLHQLNSQRKGLIQPVMLDGKELTDWSIYPLEFKPEFINRTLTSSNWKVVGSGASLPDQPALYHTELVIPGQPHDTFISTEGWTKGVMFVNSFNLGRYWQVGPQHTLYLPAPLLKQGTNHIHVFELHAGQSSISFTDKPVLA